MSKHGTAYSVSQFSQVSAGITLALPAALEGIDPKKIIFAISKKGEQLSKKLNVALAELLLSPVILKKLNDDPIIIGPTNGKRVIADAKDVFTGGIYGFKKSKPAPSTDATNVNAYGLIENGMFMQMFPQTFINDDGVLARQLCKTEHQIIEFCIKHRNWLSPGATFFLMEEDGEFVVVGVHVYSDGLHVNRNPLGRSYEWNAEYGHRVVA